MLEYGEEVTENQLNCMHNFKSMIFFNLTIYNIVNILLGLSEKLVTANSKCVILYFSNCVDNGFLFDLQS